MNDEPLNKEAAAKLEQVADLLAQQGANPFRIAAYRRAAATVSAWPQDLRSIIDNEGYEGLIALPNIGKGIASAIWEMAATGRWGQLERLRGTLDPVELFQTVPGIGPDLASHIHDTLHVDTLEGLEAAAHNERLASVPGIGHRRLAALKASLASMLGGARRRHLRSFDGPGVEQLLDVAQEYRDKVAAGELSRIAPKRFNPQGQAWLPILHANRGPWHFTVMYSNTARAHELGKTGDWIVVYFYDDSHEEGQATIVTETRGPLTGRPVVRGREHECRAYYQQGK